MAKLKLDLHEIYNRGEQIDAELNRIVQEALSKKIALVEISGKYSPGSSIEIRVSPRQSPLHSSLFSEGPIQKMLSRSTNG